MNAPNQKEWTLMFYFASDNALAPGIVSQLKALKNAGYHPQVNVIAQFDPQTEGTPTHIFDVNHVEKLKRPSVADIGFAARDSFVRNLMEDKLWRDQKDRHKRPIRDGLKLMLADKGVENYSPPVPPNDRNLDGGPSRRGAKELDPRSSLWSFLKFCRDYYPAHHYMLFILGHGVVVGNDIFLLDEHAEEQSLSLVELGRVLNRFKLEIADHKGEFELVSFNSCSVSSLEVAYELQDTAKYMLASQGPAFVGSWPYRQILIRIFNGVMRQGLNVDVDDMVRDIFNYCMHNSTDFLLAGYSFDLCLCRLDKVPQIKAPLGRLSKVLIEAMRMGDDALPRDRRDSLLRDLILLAHWKSQSYWQETYTDLYDFCRCLFNYLGDHGDKAESVTLDRVRAIRHLCEDIMFLLDRRDAESMIVASVFLGPAYQYSHGMSVYLPWSEPLSDTPFMDEYKGYKINQREEEGEPHGSDGGPPRAQTEFSWYDFLTAYFKKTMRETRKEEERKRKEESGERPPQVAEEVLESLDATLFEDRANLVYTEEGRMNAGFSLSKATPRDLTGDDSVTLSIKNYPHDTRARRAKAQQASQEGKRAPISPTVCGGNGHGGNDNGHGGS